MSDSGRVEVVSDHVGPRDLGLATHLPPADRRRPRELA